jgi:hypothetical protein
LKNKNAIPNSLFLQVAAKLHQRQSDQLWERNKNAQQQFGYPWHWAFDQASASRQSSALDALVAAVASSNLNLGLGATATGSAPCTPESTAQNAFDGASRWGSKWCSGGAGGQSLTADLGAERMIVGFRLRHAAAGGENPAWNTRDFEIETSVDGASWLPAVSVTNNTFGVTTHPIPALNARYARLHVTKAQPTHSFWLLACTNSKSSAPACKAQPRL